MSSERSDPASETVIDGWYIDLETRPSCERDTTGRARAVLIARETGRCAQQRRSCDIQRDRHTLGVDLVSGAAYVGRSPVHITRKPAVPQTEPLGRDSP
jgi:hypothetical protein